MSKNITLEGIVSQISFLGPSCYFIGKNGKHLMYFLNIFFQDFIKQKLGHLKEI